MSAHGSDAPSPESAPAPDKKCCNLYSVIGSLTWWSVLLIAVLALPVVGVSLALAVQGNEFVQLMVFVLSCWGCTWLGMWLVRKTR